MDDKELNGWGEWSRYVLKTLETQAEDIKNINTSLQQIKVDIAMLQVKSSVWGALGALVVIVVSKLVRF